MCGELSDSIEGRSPNADRVHRIIGAGRRFSHAEYTISAAIVVSELLLFTGSVLWWMLLSPSGPLVILLACIALIAPLMLGITIGTYAGGLLLFRGVRTRDWHIVQAVGRHLRIPHSCALKESRRISTLINQDDRDDPLFDAINAALDEALQDGSRMPKPDVQQHAQRIVRVGRCYARRLPAYRLVVVASMQGSLVAMYCLLQLAYSWNWLPALFIGGVALAVGFMLCVPLGELVCHTVVYRGLDAYDESIAQAVGRRLQEAISTDLQNMIERQNELDPDAYEARLLKKVKEMSESA